MLQIIKKRLLSLGNLKHFGFRELQHATYSFSSKNILGAGGFGNVYKGKAWRWHVGGGEKVERCKW